MQHPDTSSSETPGTQALVLTPQAVGSDKEHIERKYRFSTATSITFCPPFFDDTKYPNLVSILDNTAAKDLTLNNADCRERVMMHEYMHLEWIRDLEPPVDYTGYVDAASVAALKPWGTAQNVPETYAWYAVYSFLNNMQEGCAKDAWPQEVKKPVNL